MRGLLPNVGKSILNTNGSRIGNGVREGFAIWGSKVKSRVDCPTNIGVWEGFCPKTPLKMMKKMEVVKNGAEKAKKG